MADTNNGRTDDERRFSKAQLTAIGIAAAIFFLDGLIHTILGPMAPEISREMGLDNTTLGPIFSANLMGQTIGLLSFPIIAGRYGHRVAVIIAVIGFCLAQFATALAWDATSLFSFRFIDGIFLGGAMPSGLAIVAKVAPKARRGLAVSMLFTGYGAGATASGIVASAFLDAGGWRIAVGLIGCVSALTALVAIRYLHGVDGPPEQSVGTDGQPADKDRILDVVRPRLLAGTLLLWTLFICMLTIQYCLSSWLPTLLVQVGRDQSFAALSVTIFSLGGIIAALGVGILIDRFGATQVLVTLLLIATTMLFIIGQVLASASGTMLMVLLGIGGFFFLGAYGGVNVVLATYYPEALRAIGIGLTKSVGRVGTFVAPVMIGIGLDAGIAETSIMSSFALPAGVAALSVLGIGIAARWRQRRMAAARL
ncbi:MFS transporter [Aurantiacibacter rhizosphaerae]|uniref:MFS transporter n=1 Tax=Aurantiacibacter rhizosphaerae TaxID=2691582 RepID=A0A844XCB2_9SPHN|nr:MFS transporter [Aurantiacibacter rhizosphaerae]MWV27419.1 MFS transporter [Aurantiacibacter rhizosphaerae]